MTDLTQNLAGLTDYSTEKVVILNPAPKHKETPTERYKMKCSKCGIELASVEDIEKIIKDKMSEKDKNGYWKIKSSIKADDVTKLAKALVNSVGQQFVPMTIDEIENKLNSFVIKYNFSFKDIPVRNIAKLLVNSVGQQFVPATKEYKIVYPVQCSCGHLFLESYQFSKPNTNGEIGFCWCGFCKTKMMVKPVNEYYDKNPERAEREQKAAEERRQEELRQEREEYERQQEAEK